MQITERSGQRIVATASVAAIMPACKVDVVSAAGAGEVALGADSEPEILSPESGGCSAQYFEELLTPPPSPLGYTIQPKDFSFTAGFVDAGTNRYALHLFYTRHNYWYYQPPTDHTKWHPELDEKNLGHAWTSDFISWHGDATGDKTDTTQIRVRAGKFDELHVWAPTIVHPPGPTFYMFYTGVRKEGTKEHQRIGFATSTDLKVWSQNDAPVLTAPEVPWAKTNPTVTYSGNQQLRDPYVIEYPAHSGHYVMYFVSVDSLNASSTEAMAVGAATSTDLIHWSALPKPFAGTELRTFQGPTLIVESPHIFRRHGQWWMPYTAGSDQVFFQTSASASPTDTVAANWTSPVWLRGVSQGRPAELQYWHASEHLGEGSTEWLAAFDDNSISIDIKGMFATDSIGVDSVLLYCPPMPPVAGVDDSHGSPAQLQLIVLAHPLGASGVGIRAEMPWREVAHLAVYDLAGRRLRTLLDGELPVGATDVRWDGTADAGNRVASGVYFVRLSCARGARVSRVVMLR